MYVYVCVCVYIYIYIYIYTYMYTHIYLRTKGRHVYADSLRGATFREFAKGGLVKGGFPCAIVIH